MLLGHGHGRELRNVGAVGNDTNGRLKLGEAEIENFGVTISGDEDVGGFDVTVNDVLGVSGVESVSDFDPNIKDLFQLNRTIADNVLSVLPSRYSITMKARSASPPMSWMVQMFG